MRLCLILAGVQLLGASLGAQTSPPVDTIAEARRLRDVNDFASAAVLMGAYVESHPDDPGSARFAALMSYWAKDPASADSIYARALGAHGGDVELRLEYGRFLIETGASTRARRVLAPVEGDSVSSTPTQIARAGALLGTADYWGGDLTTARRRFASALRLDSSLTDARRQLAEIETAAASWVRVRSDVWDDDQPLHFATFAAEGGWFATPLTSLGITARSSLFDRDGTAESLVSTEGTLATYAANAHLDLAAAGGVLQRSFDRSADWTARATLGFRLPRSVRIDARVERAPYTSTVRSLARAVMVRTLDAGMKWGAARTWMGEFRVRRESYPDDNAVSTAFGWMLVPLASRAKATVHAGYAFAAQSADESRFLPRGDIIVPPGQAPVTVPGEYDPYYTSQNLRVHSALAAIRLRPSSRWTLDGDGRYAVSAHDDAPVLVAVEAPPNVTIEHRFYRRSFTPWNARGSIDCWATPSLHIGLAVEHGREAYYEFTSARVQLTYTFVTAALRRADVR